ncbi:MAG: hypothetical protein XD60_0745 [Acetothermia bacterium 64_32]|nr:MAG: hypothetical protein XD60_0745 [Acetothermia bacterium 64_32]
MRGRLLALVVVGLVLVSVWGLTPGIAGGGGGVVLDVDPSHPAYPAVKYLIDTGVISIADTGGEFRGDSALLRYDAAQWLYRAMQRMGQAQAGVDVAGLESRLNSLQAQVQNLQADVASNASGISSLKTSVNSISSEVQSLKTQAPAGLSGRVQTNFLLGITGVLLGIAAVAMVLFWP